MHGSLTLLFNESTIQDTSDNCLVGKGSSVATVSLARFGVGR
jgi:hypothetical protein